MPKPGEIAYVTRMATVLGVSAEDVEQYLMGKPYSDPNRHAYLIDVGQIMRLLPPPPASVLDLGAGSGWTSVMLAHAGYSVVGLDIAPDMIALARRQMEPALDLRFEVFDYEQSLESFGTFRAVVIYDALHHAEDESAVIARAYGALEPEGVLVTIEPGAGHGSSAEADDTRAKFGTTEKDMPYSHQATLMRRAGFSTVRQHLRLSQLPTLDLEGERERQWEYVAGWWDHTLRRGLTSVVVAVK